MSPSEIREMGNLRTCSGRQQIGSKDDKREYITIERVGLRQGMMTGRLMKWAA